MRAVVIHAAKDLRVEECQAETAGPGEVEIAVEVGGICGSDLHYFNHGGFGTVRLREPMILGHEVAGRIAALGDGVEGLAVGDRVAVSPSRPCEACEYCLAGLSNQCLNMRFYGSAMPLPHIQGAFRQRLVALASQCHKVAEGVSVGDWPGWYSDADRASHEDVEAQLAKLVASIDPADPWAHPDLRRLDRLSVADFMREVGATPAVLRAMDLVHLSLSNGSIERQSMFAYARKQAVGGGTAPGRPAHRRTRSRCRPAAHPAARRPGRRCRRAAARSAPARRSRRAPSDGPRRRSGGRRTGRPARGTRSSP